MIADQRDVVAWWDEHVRRKGGAGCWHSDNADRHDRSVAEAEETHRHQTAASAMIAPGTGHNGNVLQQPHGELYQYSLAVFTLVVCELTHS
jgi:hypothetical protein